MGYFKKDKTNILLDCQYAEFYIPKDYLDNNKYAEDLGSTIKTIGVLNVGFFENGKLKEMRILNIPTWISLFVSDSEMRSMNFPHSTEPISVKVIKYNKGNPIMANRVIQDSDYARNFVDFVMSGKVPPMIPYNKVINIWEKNMAINNVNVGVPFLIEEMVLSVAYRYYKDPSKMFCEVCTKDPKISMYDYVMNNVRQICQYTSTFTGLTFEDIDTMITTSLNRTRNKGNEAFSPIEEIIKL